MRILHCSDTHGLFPTLPGDPVDVVVHSGDFFGNRSRGIRSIEAAYQEHWLADNMGKLKRWLDGRPFLFCPGNHDFYNPVEAMRAAGIYAQDLECKRVEFGGLSFFGLPYVRWFTGEWNYELSEPELERVYANVPDDIDVLVSHGPMFGVLDRVRPMERAGSMALRAHLQNAKRVPKALLCGHIHEAAGVQGWSRGLIVSNAALTYQVIAVTK